MAYLNYPSDRYYLFTFCKSDYVLLSKTLHNSIEVFRMFKFFCSSVELDKIISDLNELAWQLDTQVERQQYFDSKGV